MCKMSGCLGVQWCSDKRSQFWHCKEFHLDAFLAESGLSMAQFIDLSILLGCDYCDKIRGIGPKSALELIKKHHTIEKILENMASVLMHV